MGYYDKALICLGGHVINDHARTRPQHNTKYCSKCGKQTIDKCEECNADIPGEYECDGVVVLSTSIMKAPAYCVNCGHPYPWTKSAIDSTTELINEEESLSPEIQKKMIESLPDIICETPKTNVAVLRIKKALLSVGKFTAEGLRQFVIDFGCALAKSQFGL